MSTMPTHISVPADASRLPMTLPRLAEKKQLGEPIVMVTAYDYPSARAAEEAGVDLVLVGDSGAMTVLGYPSTVAVTLDELLMLARATRRGVNNPFLIGDLPFGSYEVSDEQAVAAAFRFAKEAGCDAVKLEGGGPMSVARARAISHAGIPVMGHIGLTPQTATAIGGYKAQGRTNEDFSQILQDALALEKAGAFAIVVEAVVETLGRSITESVECPTIGIGASPACDGQILVVDDMLGMTKRDARFVKRYEDLAGRIDAAVAEYSASVRSRAFPEHGNLY